MYRKMIVMTAATLMVGMWAAEAATGGGVGTTPLRCLDTAWRRSEVSTSSATFVDVPGFTDSPSSIFPIAIEVSAVVSGAPVEFRVLSTNVGDQTVASKPGRAVFVPVGGHPDAFSFQWIERNQSAAVHVIDLRLQWRSPAAPTPTCSGATWRSCTTPHLEPARRPRNRRGYRPPPKTGVSAK